MASPRWRRDCRVEREELHPTCINAARHLFRDEPLVAQAVQVGSAGGVDEVTSALLGFAGGRVAQITCHQGAADVSELRVIGTRGDLRLEPAYELTRGLKEHLTVAGLGAAPAGRQGRHRERSRRRQIGEGDAPSRRRLGSQWQAPCDSSWA
jgi:hypothetical protein